MAIGSVLIYISNYVIWGTFYWFIAGIFHMIVDAQAHYEGQTANLMMYYWDVMIIVFIIFTGIWLIRQYNKQRSVY